MVDTFSIANYIINICNNEYLTLLNIPNVVGIAFSYKVVNRKTTSRECIQVLVDKKLPLNRLNINHIIPSTFKGVETDVYECGQIETNSFNSTPILNYGDSIGPLNLSTVGSIGAIVKGYNRNKLVYYILSNNHVLAGENRLPFGTPILHPAPCDGGIYPINEIARLSKYIPLKFLSHNKNSINLVDCGIAKIKSRSCFNLRTFPTGTTYEFIGQQVHKTGRSSGSTTGSIISTGATVKVNYNGKKALFKNQIITTAMSTKGDSGSLLLDKNNRAVGLLFSGTKNVTLYNRIHDVLSNLNVRLVTKSNYAL